LKEAGYTYVMDWPADDQPFWLRTRAGPILSVPYPAELNDSAAIIHRDGTANDFADMERKFIEDIQERLTIWAALQAFFDAEDEATREESARHFNALTDQYPDQVKEFFIHLPAYYPENTLPEYVRYCEMFNLKPSNGREQQ